MAEDEEKTPAKPMVGVLLYGIACIVGFLPAIALGSGIAAAVRSPANGGGLAGVGINLGLPIMLCLALAALFGTAVWHRWEASQLKAQLVGLGMMIGFVLLMALFSEP